MQAQGDNTSMSKQEAKGEIVFSPYDHVLKYILPLIPKKVKPNHITFFRLIMSPVVLGWLVVGQYRWALVLFIILAFSDALDGTLARMRNQITHWGEIWDPIADKLLVGSVVVVLLMQINFSLTIFLLAFELAFVLGGTFMTVAHADINIKANMWGKIKMNLHVLGGVLLMIGFFVGNDILVSVAQVVFYISLFFAAVSLIKKGI